MTATQQPTNGTPQPQPRRQRLVASGHVWLRRTYPLLLSWLGRLIIGAAAVMTLSGLGMLIWSIYGPDGLRPVLLPVLLCIIIVGVLLATIRITYRTGFDAGYRQSLNLPPAPSKAESDRMAEWTKAAIERRQKQMGPPPVRPEVNY